MKVLREMLMTAEVFFYRIITYEEICDIGHDFLLWSILHLKGIRIMGISMIENYVWIRENKYLHFDNYRSRSIHVTRIQRKLGTNIMPT